MQTWVKLHFLGSYASQDLHSHSSGEEVHSIKKLCWATFPAHITGYDPVIWIKGLCANAYFPYWKSGTCELKNKHFSEVTVQTNPTFSQSSLLYTNVHKKKRTKWNETKGVSFCLPPKMSNNQTRCPWGFWRRKKKYISPTLDCAIVLKCTLDKEMIAFIEKFTTYSSQEKGACYITQGHTGKWQGQTGGPTQARAFTVVSIGRNGRGRVGRLSKLKIGYLNNLGVVSSCLATGTEYCLGVWKLDTGDALEFGL